ncbi:MAG: guanylate kinase [Dethiobacteria bacterium]
MKKGLLLIISGPSGVGKNTICQGLCERIPNLYYSISITTRPPRPGEEEGVNYYFVKEEHFKRLRDEHALLEWAKVYGHYYGSPSRQIEKERNKGRDVILEIDIQGAKKIRENVQEGIYIFLVPPSMKALWQRISTRGTDTPEAMKMRFTAACRELKEAMNYDYVVVNDHIMETVKFLEAIIMAEKCRPGRNKGIIEKLLEEGDDDDLPPY